MKTLKSIMLGLSMLVICSVAQAGPKPTKTQVAEIFMNAAAHGKTDGLENVLDSKMEFNTKRGDRTITSDKDQLMTFLNASKGVDQNCKCTSTVVDDNDEQMIVRIEMKYETYTRVNVVTITNWGLDTWRISKVNTSVVA